MLYWVIGLVISGSALAVYLELASYFPNRSGGEVVYLEQAYPRPKYFFPTAFAVLSVLLSFSSSNAIGMILFLINLTMLIRRFRSPRAISVCNKWTLAYSMGVERRCRGSDDGYYTL